MARTANPGLAERRRRQIMDAALSCFRRRGFHLSSMHEICAEAQMSPGAVYRYFPSKTDIIAAIAQEDGGDWRAVFDDVNDAESLIARFGVVARAVVAKVNKSGDAPLIGDIVSEALRNPDLARRLRAKSAPLKQHLRGVLAECQARGEVDDAIAPERLTHLMLAAFDGACLRAVVDGREMTHVEADVREMMRRLLRPAGAARKPAAKTARARSAAREEHAK
ncbi:MAG: TetR/AcrR family transcriptional regulator [Hyphomonadaceae bacterium]